MVINTIMKRSSVSALSVLVLAMTMTSTTFAVNSNVKPIPKNFNGKWAGLHSAKKKLNQAILKDLCENGGEQDTSYFATFDPDRHKITNVAFWEDLTTEYPISYSQYNSNHIKGQSLSVSFEMGEDDTLSTKTVHKFDYKLAGDKLFIGTVDGKSIEMRRCS